MQLSYEIHERIGTVSAMLPWGRTENDMISPLSGTEKIYVTATGTIREEKVGGFVDSRKASFR